MKKIESIKSIGGIDADNDELLIKCFQNHNSYNQIKNLEKFIVLGRKGTGKTAIFKRFLIQNDSRFFSFGHTFSDYPWHYHDKQVKIGVPDFDKYTHSWKYLILMSLSKILLNHDQSTPYDEVSLDYLTKIEAFIVDTYGSRDPDVTQIFTPSKKIKIKSSFKVDVGIFQGSVTPDNIPMEYLPTIIQEVNSNLIEYIVSSLNPAHTYHILFDQLDLGFDPKNPEYYNRVIGLLLAAKEINRVAKEKGKKMSIIIFLRDDIYNSLKFEDKNKLTRSSTSIIEWDIPGSHTLKELIEKRLTELLKETDNDEVKWGDVFDESQLMTGKQTKYNYITDRTFLRPRDVIQFCNEIIQSHNSNPEKVELISNKEINDAKPEYSKYFLDELDDEIHKHIPQYDHILEIIKIIGYHQFDIEDFEKAIQQKKSSFGAYDSLKKLFEFSIVGYYKAGGSGYGGSEYIFKYRNTRSQFEESAKLFRVHPGLIDFLGLKRSTKPKE
ncbi:MAG TPA: hypothetical protein VK151_00245 [Fluviicola sp.]|nr:hypothetical protein [Fluviicola sp.]